MRRRGRGSQSRQPRDSVRQTQIVQDALARNDIELIRGRARFAGSHEVTVQELDGRRDLTAPHLLRPAGAMKEPRGQARGS